MSPKGVQKLHLCSGHLLMTDATLTPTRHQPQLASDAVGRFASVERQHMDEHGAGGSDVDEATPTERSLVLSQRRPRFFSEMRRDLTFSGDCCQNLYLLEASGSESKLLRRSQSQSTSPPRTADEAKIRRTQSSPREELSVPTDLGQSDTQQQEAASDTVRSGAGGFRLQWHRSKPKHGSSLHLSDSTVVAVQAALNRRSLQV
ncbi:unnamed protein product [Protopolystoma xenopodis]|uniref:Uncharacterized protein n=1 Tax=Protopolystoma xenopodis TaxID=117903 RepID=A0A3S5AH23_9PLAT|nr:unnamed protein product [Protopolystoma xenopodis]